MFSRILVAVDGSDHSMRALEAGARLALAEGARLVVITASYVPPLYKADLNTEIQEGFRDSARMVLDDARRALERLGVDAEAVVIEGQPGEAVAAYAAKGGFDLVALGRRGLNVKADKRLGGVSDAVLHLAECSVMLVH